LKWSPYLAKIDLQNQNTDKSIDITPLTSLIKLKFLDLSGNDIKNLVS
jgi:Leucine-rich repeat (LRR) protein